MSKIHFHKNTTLTPERYIAGLTDFSPGRSKVFSNSAENQLEVHSLGPTEADVTDLAQDAYSHAAGSLTQ